MTPADELRQAAQHIRNLAGKATRGPWTHDRDEEAITGPLCMIADVYDEPSADHIAFWDPAIAELVADLLDGSADHWNSRPAVHHEYFEGLPIATLARAINAKQEARNA